MRSIEKIQLRWQIGKDTIFKELWILHSGGWNKVNQKRSLLLRATVMFRRVEVSKSEGKRQKRLLTLLALCLKSFFTSLSRRKLKWILAFILSPCTLTVSLFLLDCPMLPPSFTYFLGTSESSQEILFHPLRPPALFS